MSTYKSKYYTKENPETLELSRADNIAQIRMVSPQTMTLGDLELKILSGDNSSIIYDSVGEIGAYLCTADENGGAFSVCGHVFEIKGNGEWTCTIMGGVSCIENTTFYSRFRQFEFALANGKMCIRPAHITLNPGGTLICTQIITNPSK